MFGNRLGWGISAVLTAAILYLVYLLGTLNAISQPSQGIVARTGNVSLNLRTHPDLLDPIRLPFDPKAVLPSMTDTRDAAPLYRQAIDLANADRYHYRDLFETGKPRTTDLKQLPAVQLLIDAKNARSMTLFAAQPEQVVDYLQKATEPIEALYTVGKAAARLALYIQKDDPALALNLAEAAFSLGVKMCDERVRYREFDAGADLLRDGAYLIAKLDPARAAVAGGVDAGMKALLKERCVPLWTVISSIDQDVIGRSAGDVFYIAKNSKERVWQTEAVLKLGRYKYNAGENGRGADQRWAGLTVKRMADNPSLDPVVRTAAKAANELTHEKFNMIGG